MKNKFFLFIIISLPLFSCVKTHQQENRITVTIEPQRYFASQLADTFFIVETMVPPGTSPETYDPSPVQLTGLDRSKAYFCIGYIGFEETWIDKLKANHRQVKFFDNSKGVSLIEIDAHAHEGHHHGKTDPHIWSSPREALTIAKNMYEALQEIDPGHAAIYTENYRQLTAQIKETDEKITDILKSSSRKAFVIYHPALSYFARDYGLVQYCIENDGKEPSPEHLKELVETVKNLQIGTIFVQQEFDRKNAEAIARETGCKLVGINPLTYDWNEEMIRIAQALADE
ncbi:MAG: zinc ABC transporter substrate-binding protein [Dysgonamonadaceae bacterium]|jgi:zinc transport system substrate-binding protein|nr:zinc ABC transporter substrate-binding protein [Dysgonamonadaceae bacterium]